MKNKYLTYGIALGLPIGGSLGVIIGASVIQIGMLNGLVIGQNIAFLIAVIVGTILDSPKCNNVE